jgi:glyoxylase-like metal-dependent hydrolase (beta-lactamase superfamily II)
MYSRQFVLSSLGHASYLAGDPDDGEAVRLRLLHTPGHTPPSMPGCWCRERDGPELLLSGGALLAGSVGRPDLLGGPCRRGRGRAPGRPPAGRSGPAATWPGPGC